MVRARKKEWSDMEAMIRDWPNWTWLSGDHIVEQHVHNLDTILWFTGMNPARAMAWEGRPACDWRPVRFLLPAIPYANGSGLESMCRQIDGCTNEVSEYVVGSEGFTNCKNAIFDPTGKVVWQYQEAGSDPGKSKFNPYNQEHVDFVTAIRKTNRLTKANMSPMPR